MSDRKVENRRELADAIAAWMKGEMSTSEFRDATCNIVGMEDIESQDIASELHHYYLEKTDGPIRVSRNGWKQLSRWLIFLRSDYHLEQKWPPLTKISFVIPLLLLVILAFAYGVSMRFFVMTWFFIAVAWTLMIYVRDHRNIQTYRYDPEFRKMREFAPFLSDEDFTAHRHLLEEFNLPPYTAPEGNITAEYKYPETDSLYIIPIMLLLPLVLIASCLSRQKFRFLSTYVRTEKKEE